jgi:hypothetical protein
MIATIANETVCCRAAQLDNHIPIGVFLAPEHANSLQPPEQFLDSASPTHRTGGTADLQSARCKRHF